MSLEFTINLGGNFVDALEKTDKGLDDTDRASRKAAEGVKIFEGELGKMKAGALGINFSALTDGGHLFTFDLAEGARMAYEAVHKLTEEVLDLGKEIIHAAANAEDLNLAIKLDVGEEGLEKVSGLAESFRGTRFDDKNIKSMLLPILEESGDTHAGQWDDLVTAATDVATRRNTGSAGAKSALDALRSIEIQPQKVRGALKELGIKQVDFYDDLGDLLGISAAAAEKQTKAGKIKSETLLSVALNQIAEREGGSLGNATNEGAKTLGSTLERLGNLKENLFEQLAGSRGMRAVQGFLDNFITTMEGPIGTDLVQKIGGAFESLFGDLSGPDGLAKMGGVLGMLKEKAVDFIDGFREHWPEIKAGFESTITVVEALAKVLGVVIKGFEMAATLADKVSGYADERGQALADSATGTVGRQKLGDGWSVSLDERDREDALRRAGKDGFFHKLFSSDDTLNREAFSQIDDDKGAWEKVPQMADGGVVRRATLALVGEAGPEAVIPLDQLASMDRSGQSSSAPVMYLTYSPSFHFSGASADVQHQVEAFDQENRAEIQKFMGQVIAGLGG